MQQDRPDEPLQAGLSDSVNRIDATISKNAVDRFTKKTRKRLTDGTIGGLIQLQEFEIVVTHLGARQKRMTLLVTNFKHLGSNGSGVMSVPRAIQDAPQVKVLLDKLKLYREGAPKSKAPSTQQLDNEEPSLASQLHGSSPDDDLLESQTIFATQAPPQKIIHDVGDLTNQTGSRTNTHPNPSDAKVEVPVPPPNPSLSSLCGQHRTAVKDGTGGLRPSDGQTQPANGKKHKPTTGAELLGLLKQVQQATNAKSVPKIAAPALPSTGSSTDVPTVLLSAAIQHPPSATATEPVTSPRQHNLSPSSTSTSQIPTEKESGSAVAQVIEQPSASGNSFKKRKCISRRDVTIGKEQEQLLNREDCKANAANRCSQTNYGIAWLPAQPGQREPSAHIPISILRSLNRQANTRANLKLPSHKEPTPVSSSARSQKARSSCSLDDDVDGRADSESDALLSASEWPPSPPQNQLPPNSSTESAGSVSELDLTTRTLSRGSVSPQLLQTKELTSPHPVDISQKATPASPESQVSPSPEANESQVGDPMSGSCASTPVSARSRAVKANGLPARKESFDSQVQNSSQPSVQNSELSNVHTEPPQVPVSPNISIPVADSPTSLKLPSTGVNRSQRDEESSVVYSIPSSPTSDIDMEVPLPLDTGSAIQPLPSTASQSTEPFTQVKRTPYVNGRKHIDSPERSIPRSPPLNPASLAFQPSCVLLEEVDHITQSAPSVTETSSAEARFNKPNHDHPSKQSLSAQSHAKNFTIDSALVIDLDNEMPENLGSSHVSEERSTNLEIKPPETLIEEQGESDKNASTLIGNHGNTGHEAKRKVSDEDNLSPNVSKRRRKIQLPKALDATQGTRERPDPKEGAKRYRQDFLASRKISKITVPPKRGGTTTVIPANQLEEPQSRLTDLGDAPTHSELSQTQSSDLQLPISLSAKFPCSEKLQDRDSDLVSRKSATPDPKTPTPHVERNLQENHSQVQENVDLISMDEAEPGALDHDPYDVNAFGTDEGEVDPSRSQESEMKNPSHEDKQNLITTMDPANPNGAPQSPRSQNFRMGDAEEAQHKIISQAIEKNTNEPIRFPSPLRSMQAATPGKDVLSPRFDTSRGISPHGYAQAASAESPVLDVYVHRAQAIHVLPITDRSHDPQSQTMFDRFKTAYPTYPGNQKHFVAICGKIRNLLSNNRMEHPSLWDDFIVRHKIDYQQYMQRCAEDVEDPIRYEDFYRAEIEQPVYLKRVITPKSLGEALSMDHKTGTLEQQSRNGSGTETPLSGTPVNLANMSGKNQKPSERRVTIDLTGNEQHDDIRSPLEAASVSSTSKRTQPLLVKRRVLPWKESKDLTDQDSRTMQAASRIPYAMARRKEKTVSEESVAVDEGQLPDRRIPGLGNQPKKRRSDQSGISPRRPGSRRSVNETKHTNEEDDPGGWWQDDNTPFKSFIKSYKAIRPGNGNSYAQPETKPKRAGGLRKSAKRAKGIDFLNWEL